MCARSGAGRVLGWYVIAAVILGHNDVRGVEVATVIGSLKLGSEILKLFYSMWNELETANMAGMRLPELQDKEQDVRAMIVEVSRHLERLEEQHAVTSAMITNLQNDLRALPDIIKVDRNLDTLTDLMNRVDTSDTQLNRYIQRGYNNETDDAKWQLERHTLEDFVTTVVSHGPSSIRGLLERIHSIVAPNERKGSRLRGPGIFAQLTRAMHVSH
ncbi:hypothetical protein L798_01614 [Zootermopsis nevadensis]|uniref:Uncharacterized protein n=1 Tax=Zootermopsis nevadensis TaxID=136037 RepID=A0A067QHF3_ZOONE|nr:hypothetical protein L798_01614 [Zootermopsis nevadensis]